MSMGSTAIPGGSAISSRGQTSYFALGVSGFFAFDTSLKKNQNAPRPSEHLVNNTNSAIPLTEIFDRVFSDVCNSLGYEVQKQKNGDRGTIVFTATLTLQDQ